MSSPIWRKILGSVTEPAIIQGGMGVGISHWRLARAVSRLGQLGVVSGTALDQVCARRLQDGDRGGHLSRAFAAFPFPALAARVWQRYFRPGGKAAHESYQQLPMQAKENPPELQELCILANFAEVWLARQEHSHPVGINYLEKIQIPHLPSLYGAMLAGVSYVLMGAGVPMKIPGVLDRFARHEAATYPLHVTGAQPGDDTTLHFDPRDYIDGAPAPLPRPRFLAIVASHVLAATLLAKANGRVDGFIVESPTAGGHNAPPRGRMQLSPAGEPIYGERDRVDLAHMRALERPFWLAGSRASAEQLQQAQAAGAAGVQVGTAFAFCEESGLRPDYRDAVIADVLAGRARVFTDPVASPTGFPFKVVQLAGTVAEPEVYNARPRICDLGYLREAYRTPEGGVGFRCPAEPVSLYVAKGGKIDDTVGRRCLCNGLVATHGHPQVRGRGASAAQRSAGLGLGGPQPGASSRPAHLQRGRLTSGTRGTRVPAQSQPGPKAALGPAPRIEPGIVTSGDEIDAIAGFLAPGARRYSAADVITALLSPDATPTSAPALLASMRP